MYEGEKCTLHVVLNVVLNCKFKLIRQLQTYTLGFFAQKQKTKQNKKTDINSVHLPLSVSEWFKTMRIFSFSLLPLHYPHSPPTTTPHTQTHTHCSSHTLSYLLSPSSTISCSLLLWSFKKEYFVSCEEARISYLYISLCPILSSRHADWACSWNCSPRTQQTRCSSCYFLVSGWWNNDQTLRANR